MKLRAIRLSNVRRFTSPVGIEGIGDGVNLLCEANEFGKSTLFDALQAVFFAPHRSKGGAVQSLQPHEGGDPRVEVEVETAEGSFTILKQWLRAPEARVSQGPRLVAQSDAAEDWIARLMGDPKSGPSGLIWVRQGLTALDHGTKGDQESATNVRRDLMSSVGHEVEAMTGGRRMDRAMQRCAAELSVLVTSKGRPRTGGAWKAAIDRLEASEADVATLEVLAATLRDALDQRRTARRDLAAQTDPQVVADRRDRLDQATAAHASAQRHADRLTGLSRDVDLARLARDGAGAQLTRRTQAATEHREAEVAVAMTASTAQTATEADRAASDMLATATDTLQTARAARQTADATRRAAQAAQAAQDSGARAADLTDRLTRAETAQAQMTATEAARQTGPDAAQMQRLEALDVALRLARATRDGAAPQMTIAYLPGRDGTVTRDGSPLAGDVAHPLPDIVTLALDGIGRLILRPGAGDAPDVTGAQDALQSALDALDQADLPAARAAHALRITATEAHAAALALRDALAPGGPQALRDALAAIPVADPDAPAFDLPAADTALRVADGALVAAQGARDAVADARGETRSQAATAAAAATAATERLARTAQALAQTGDTTLGALQDGLDQAGAMLAKVMALRSEAARDAPDLTATATALTRAQGIDENARIAVTAASRLIAVLDERIARGAGDAVEERLDAARQVLAVAQSDLARILHEIAVLQRLQTALADAKAAARERYLAPVAAELAPLLTLLWPGAELDWTPDTLLPATLRRNGQTEAIDVLSGGTQEQVALLVRLAFARLLARSGRHAPVILDDALVFTDDDRIERMFDALHRQAGDLQILVLSCRQRAFRDLGAQVLRLTGRPDEGG